MKELLLELIESLESDVVTVIKHDNGDIDPQIYEALVTINKLRSVTEEFITQK